MLKHITIAFMAVPFLFASCSKNNNNDPKQDGNYSVNGIHDINFQTGANYLELDVKLKEGSTLQETVKLTMSGLPAGIAAKIEPENGIPSFSSILTFTRAGKIAAGTYAVKLTGTTPGGTRVYDFNVIIPEFNGFTFGDQEYVKYAINKSSDPSSPYININSYDNGSGYIEVHFNNGAFPTTSKVYKIVDQYSVDTDDEVYIMYYGSIYGFYASAGTDGKAATVNVKDGKVSISITDVALKAVSGGTDVKILSASVQE